MREEELELHLLDFCYVQINNEMITSIRVYDAAKQLYQLSQQLSGPTLSQGSIISELMRVSDVIKRLRVSISILSMLLRKWDIVPVPVVSLMVLFPIVVNFDLLK